MPVTPHDVRSPQHAANQFLATLKIPSRILVAISGGSDSAGLLVALAETLEDHPGVSLCAATVDHALRSESADEACAVAALCAKLNIPHRICLWSGDKPKKGMMAAAREARYTLLSAAARDFGADVIVTAHTLGDQQETIAMRAERNDAPGKGLAGIADAVLFDREIWIMRPFLGCRREDIRTYLTELGLTWADDPSNDDLKYERVRIRRSLEIAPAPVNLPSGAERESLAREAALWMVQHVTIHHQIVCHVASAGLHADDALLGYALGHLAAVLGGRPYSPGRETFARILAFLRADVPSRMTAGRVVFDLRRDGLYLTREGRDLPVLGLQAGESGVWDGRFRIVNPSASAVYIGSAAATDALKLFAGLPRLIGRRAAAAMPKATVSADHDLPPGSSTDVTIDPVFAPFDRFLTRFDLEFANSISAAFGRKLFCSRPLEVIDGKRI